MKKTWYQLNTKTVLNELNSDSGRGLSADEVTIRLKQYGYNELEEKPRDTLWKKFLSQFKDFLVFILLAASVISLAVGEVADSLVIIAIVLLNAALGVYQESKAEKALDALKKMSAPTSKVIRDGEVNTVFSRDLVPGDIILLEAGDYIPADVRMLDSYNLKVQEASLTGESVPVEKNVQRLTGRLHWPIAIIWGS